MFDKSGQWTQLETFDEFDDGLTDLIDLWASTATLNVKNSALSHFKEDLEAATLQWVDNRAKSKKYSAIAGELSEFEAALQEATNNNTATTDSQSEHDATTDA
jgi:hypothetical protein